MQLLPIKRATLVEKLVAEVRNEITSGRLLVGQRLPTEARMAAQFGVSRPLLREALAELRAEGFVQTKNGRGTFVRHPTETDLADAFGHQLLLAVPGPGPTADHLYEARQAIEVVAAQLAAERATPEALATLERLLATMIENNDDAAAYTAADVGFHIAVARATLNPLLPTLLAPLATLIVKGMYESHSTPDAVSQGIAAHTKVLRALKKHDPAAARRAMAAHLRESRRVFPEQLVGRQNGSRLPPH
jgi:GntR family transcriptional regulator, transcriptional repressor for pyruvate dehydrogenase complex